MLKASSEISSIRQYSTTVHHRQHESCKLLILIGMHVILIIAVISITVLYVSAGNVIDL